MRVLLRLEVDAGKHCSTEKTQWPKVNKSYIAVLSWLACTWLDSNVVMPRSCKTGPKNWGHAIIGGPKRSFIQPMQNTDNRSKFLLYRGPNSPKRSMSPDRSSEEYLVLCVLLWLNKWLFGPLFMTPNSCTGQDQAAMRINYSWPYLKITRSSNIYIAKSVNDYVFLFNDIPDVLFDKRRIWFFSFVLLTHSLKYSMGLWINGI